LTQQVPPQQSQTSQTHSPVTQHPQQSAQQQSGQTQTPVAQQSQPLAAQQSQATAGEAIAGAAKLPKDATRTRITARSANRGSLENMEASPE
jgi:hypothetical protein